MLPDRKISARRALGACLRGSQPEILLASRIGSDVSAAENEECWMEGREFHSPTLTDHTAGRAPVRDRKLAVLPELSPFFNRAHGPPPTSSSRP